QGIQDAFRQVESLAPVILGAISTSPSALDEALAGWARWREEDAAEYYWLAADLGKAGKPPTVLPEVAQRFVPAGQDGLAPGSVQPPLRALQGGDAATAGGCDSPLAGAWRMRPASAARRGGRPRCRGHPAKTPGPASALCPARDRGRP